MDSQRDNRDTAAHTRNGSTASIVTRTPRRGAALGGRLSMAASAVVLIAACAVAGMPNVSAASAPSPAVSMVTPSAGTAGGGNKVVITGVGFVGTTTVLFGSVPATSFIVNRVGTVIDAIAPLEAAGTVDVQVVTPVGESATVPGDVYNFLPASITSVSVAAGPVNGGSRVVITGSNLGLPSAVDFGSTPATTFIANRAGTVVKVLSPPHVPGLVDIEITAAAGTTAVVPSDEFTYLAPSITGVTPSGGGLGGGTRVVITGQDFQGTTAVWFGATPATSFAVNRPGTVIAAYTPVAEPGTVDITVVTPEATSTPVPADQYAFAPALPTVTSLSDTSGSGIGGTAVTITGTNFADVASVKFGGVPAASFTVVSSTTIDAVSPQLPIGTSNVTVTNDVGQSKVTTMAKFAATPVGCPTPINGTWDGLASTATQNFSWVATNVVFTPTAVTGVYTMTGALSVDHSPASAVVARNSSISCNTWVITDGNGAVLTGTLDSSGAFAVMDPSGTNHGEGFDGYPPLVSWNGQIEGIDSSSPLEGPLSGGTSVTITGTGFPANPVVLFGDQPAASVTPISSTEVIAVSPAVGGSSEVPVYITVGASAQDLNRTAAGFIYMP